MRRRWASRSIIVGAAWGLLIAFSGGLAVAADASWSWSDAACVTRGDAPVCAAAVTAQADGLLVETRVEVNQDSPFWGVTSSAYKEVRFERLLTFAEPTEIRLAVVLTAQLSVETEGGASELLASIVLVDTSTQSPVADLRLDSSTTAGRLSPHWAELGVLPVAETFERIAVVPAGTYVVRGLLSSRAEIARGWWNKATSCDASLAVHVSFPPETAPLPEPVSEPVESVPSAPEIGTSADAVDWLTVPLGDASTPYAHLEPGTTGGTLYYASITSPGGWNAVTSNSNSISQYTDLMYPGLVDVDPTTGAIVPELATGWDVSEDRLTLTFHLRRGLDWSDGVPFTTDDVLFTYNDLIFNEDVDTDARDILILPDGTYPTLTKVDDHTLQVTLSMPFRPILSSLGLSILPKHALASQVHKLSPDVEPGTFNGAWTVETDPATLPVLGPFRVAEYVMDQRVVLERNPHYYHMDPNGIRLPYVDSVIVHIVENQDVSMLKFVNGELDVYATRAEDIPTLNEVAAEKAMTVVVNPDLPVYGTSWIGINQDIGLAEGTHEQLRALFRDIRFRKAVAHSIDKETIIANVYNDLAVPQWSPVSVLSPFYAGRDVYGGPITERDAVIYEYAPETAAALLDEIGIVDQDGDGWRDFANGAKIEFELNTNPNTIREGIGLIVTDDLRALGLDVTFQPIDFNTLVTRLNSSTGQMILLGLSGGSEPNSGANVYSSSGGLHFWRYSAQTDPTEVELRIDELLAAGVSTYDDDEAFAVYKEYQTLLTESDLGLIYTVNPAFTYAYYNRIGNGQIANPIATPSGGSPRAVELVFFKSE